MGHPPAQQFTYSVIIPLRGLVGCLLAVLTTDILGRRTLCQIGAALATMFCALIASIGSKPNANTYPTYSNLVVASVMS